MRYVFRRKQLCPLQLLAAVELGRIGRRACCFPILTGGDLFAIEFRPNCFRSNLVARVVSKYEETGAWSRGSPPTPSPCVTRVKFHAAALIFFVFTFTTLFLVFKTPLMCGSNIFDTGVGLFER